MKKTSTSPRGGSLLAIVATALLGTALGNVSTANAGTVFIGDDPNWDYSVVATARPDGSFIGAGYGQDGLPRVFEYNPLIGSFNTYSIGGAMLYPNGSYSQPGAIRPIQISSDGLNLAGTILDDHGLPQAYLWSLADLNSLDNPTYLGALVTGAPLTGVPHGVTSGSSPLVFGTSSSGAFRWTEDSGMQEFQYPGLGFGQTSIRASSDDGSVFGGFVVAHNEGRVAGFISQNNELTLLDGLGSLNSAVYTISPNGQFAAGYNNELSNVLLWDLNDLSQPLDLGSDLYINGVTDDGILFGYSQSTLLGAIIEDGVQMLASDWFISKGIDVGDHTIYDVTSLSLHGDRYYAVADGSLIFGISDPQVVPEPSTVSLLIGGIGGMLLLRKRGRPAGLNQRSDSARFERLAA